jgi:transcriptional regulator with XRE-family HTH domain
VLDMTANRAGHNPGTFGGKSANTFGDWLRNCLDELEWTQQTLAERVGVSQSTINRWIHGDAEPHGRQIGRLSHVLGVPPRDILLRLGGTTAAVADQWRDTIAVPVLGRAAADPADWGDPIDYVLVTPPSPTTDPTRYIAVVIDGDCLTPQFLPGDVVLIDRHLPPLEGKAAVVVNGDGATHLKRLQKSGGAWQFASNRGDLVPFESVTFIGVVVQLIRDTL